MAIKTVDGVTTVTPSAWKWLFGVFLGPFVPFIGVVLLLFCLAMASGQFVNLTLTKDGITARNWGSRKYFRWTDIHDFRVRTLRLYIFARATVITFRLRENNDADLLSKTARAFGIGRKSVPAIGMPPKDLIALFQTYQNGYVPADMPSDASTSPNAPDMPPDTAAERVPLIKPLRIVPERKRTSMPTTPLIQEGFRLFGRRPPIE